MVGYFLFVILLPSCFGADYYVDFGTGSDSNDGLSTASPWEHCLGDNNAV